MFRQFESFFGIMWSLVQALATAAEQLGEEPEKFIRFLQTPDGKILLPGMVEFVVVRWRGNKPGKPLSEQLEAWRVFYKKLGHKLDTSSIRVATIEQGFERLIIVAKGFTLNQIYAAMAKRFTCSSYTDDLDKTVVHNARDSNKIGTYAIWVRERRAADQENRGKSAYDCWGQKSVFNPQMPYMTLGERMLYESIYWDETGENLDPDSWTECVSSLYADGGVPCVGSEPGVGHVGWSGPGDSHPRMGARSAVSCPLTPSGA